MRNQFPHSMGSALSWIHVPTGLAVTIQLGPRCGWIGEHTHAWALVDGHKLATVDYCKIGELLTLAAKAIGTEEQVRATLAAQLTREIGCTAMARRRFETYPTEFNRLDLLHAEGLLRKVIAGTMLGQAETVKPGWDWKIAKLLALHGGTSLPVERHKGAAHWTANQWADYCALQTKGGRP